MLNGSMTVGVAQAFFQYINQTAEPLTEASFMINSLQAALASAKRTFQLLDEEEETPNPVHPRIYLYSKVIKTYGGLPYGSSGKGVSLLSGGIDSPVATWMMAKRGVEVEGVYFHSPPYTSEWAKQKVIDLAKRIADFTGNTPTDPTCDCQQNSAFFCLLFFHSPDSFLFFHHAPIIRHRSSSYKQEEKDFRLSAIPVLWFLVSRISLFAYQQSCRLENCLKSKKSRCLIQKTSRSKFCFIKICSLDVYFFYLS